MFGHARADRAPDRFAPVRSTPSRPAADRTAGNGGDPAGSASRLGAVRKSGAGPYDSEDPTAERLGMSSGRIDFGSLRIPIPARAQLQVEKGNGDLLRAVHVLVPSGRVSLSALAAPRSNPLWRGLAGEIGESLSSDGARVRTEWGEWGREVEAASNGAISRFIGVDGPRWMLYGVATGPADGAEDLAAVLRDMMRGTVVFRGPDPLPVKTVLPLRLPEGLEERVEQAREVSKGRPVQQPVRPPAQQPPARSNGTRYVGAPAVPPARQPMPPRRPAATGPAPSRPGAGASPAAAQLPASAPAIGSLGLGGRSSSPNGLPPVPAAPEGGASRSSGVEGTWSLANPVVNAAEVAQQPAWALLSAAPSFWPDERHRQDDSRRPDDAYRLDEAGRPDDPFRLDDSWPGEAPYRPAEAGRSASDWSLADSGHSGAGPSGYGPSPDLGGPGYPRTDFGDATPLERAILSEMSFGAASADQRIDPGTPAGNGHDTMADEAWSGSDSDLLSSTDGLHAVLTHDSAATRGWAARADRRGRRRQDG